MKETLISYFGSEWNVPVGWIRDIDSDHFQVWGTNITGYQFTSNCKDQFQVLSRLIAMTHYGYRQIWTVNHGEGVIAQAMSWKTPFRLVPINGVVDLFVRMDFYNSSGIVIEKGYEVQLNIFTEEDIPD